MIPRYAAMLAANFPIASKAMFPRLPIAAFRHSPIFWAAAFFSKNSIFKVQETK
jgi:hypothetical protein